MWLPWIPVCEGFAANLDSSRRSVNRMCQPALTCSVQQMHRDTHAQERIINTHKHALISVQTQRQPLNTQTQLVSRATHCQSWYTLEWTRCCTPKKKLWLCCCSVVLHEVWASTVELVLSKQTKSYLLETLILFLYVVLSNFLCCSALNNHQL